jgi:hypothetical protein
MQVGKSTQPHPTLPPHFVSQEDTQSTPLIPSLLPLHGYHDKICITAPSLPLQLALSAEVIEIIQSFCSKKDLLSLTSIDKAALTTRFCNPRLQKLVFKRVKNTKQFLAYCQASQEKEAQELILKEGKKSHKQLKPTLLFDTTMHFTSFTREHLQAVKALNLTISAQFTAEQYDLLFTHLPGIQRLTIRSTLQSSYALIPLFKAAQRLTLYSLAIFNKNVFHDRRDRRDFSKLKDSLPNELWQLTTLVTLTIRGFAKIVSIPEDIGRLNALKSLTLENMDSLTTLPASLGQLDKLKALTLNNLPSITTLPEEMGQLKALKSFKLGDTRKLKALPASIGQLKALKSLTLHDMSSLNVLPASLGQLNNLEALTLEDLRWITALPEEIGQLNALKLLKLKYLRKLEALPARIGQLDKLEALTLGNLHISTLPEEISQLRALKVIKLINMRELKRLPEKLAQIVIRE